jgi:hypothetical protein
MNNKDLKPETVAGPDDETADADDLAPADRRVVSGVRAWSAGTPTAGTSVSRTGEKTVTAD